MTYQDLLDATRENESSITWPKSGRTQRFFHPRARIRLIVQDHVVNTVMISEKCGDPILHISFYANDSKRVGKKLYLGALDASVEGLEIARLS